MTTPPRNLVRLLDVPTHRPWVTVRWLRRKVYEQRIPFHKVGGLILIDLDDLDRMAAAGRHEVTDCGLAVFREGSGANGRKFVVWG